MRTGLRLLGRAAAVVVVVLGGAALLAGVIVPRLAGATPYAVLSGSMEPTLPLGALAVVRPVDPASIRTGDVITYQLRSGEPVVATHRVVGLGSTVAGEPIFETRGDASAATDAEPVRAVQVQGRLWYAVPSLGRVGTLLTGAQRDALSAGLVVVLLGYAAWQVVGAVRERRAASGRPPTRPAGSAAVVLVVAAALTGSVPGVPGAAAADAGPPGVGLSLDGRTWTRGTLTPLFDPGLRWVPGDARAARFYVRNESSTAATARVQVRVGPGTEALDEDLTVRTRLADDGWTPGARSAPVRLDAGGVVPVDVEVGFSAGSTNDTRRARTPLDVRVTLTGDVDGPGDPSPPADALAPTGAGVLGLLVLAVAAVLVGAGLRRRPEARTGGRHG